MWSWIIHDPRFQDWVVNKVLSTTTRHLNVVVESLAGLFAFPPNLSSSSFHICFSRASHSLSLRCLPPFFPTVAHRPPPSPTVSLSQSLSQSSSPYLALPPSSPYLSPLEGKGCSFFMFPSFFCFSTASHFLYELLGFVFFKEDFETSDTQGFHAHGV